MIICSNIKGDGKSLGRIDSSNEAALVVTITAANWAIPPLPVDDCLGGGYLEESVDATSRGRFNGTYTNTLEVLCYNGG